MDSILNFLNHSVATIVQSVVVIITAVMTIIQQFKKQDK